MASLRVWVTSFIAVNLLHILVQADFFVFFAITWLSSFVCFFVFFFFFFFLLSTFLIFFCLTLCQKSLGFHLCQFSLGFLAVSMSFCMSYCIGTQLWSSWILALVTWWLQGLLSVLFDWLIFKQLFILYFFMIHFVGFINFWNSRNNLWASGLILEQLFVLVFRLLVLQRFECWRYSGLQVVLLDSGI